MYLPHWNPMAILCVISYITIAIAMDNILEGSYNIDFMLKIVTILEQWIRRSYMSLTQDQVTVC